ADRGTVIMGRRVHSHLHRLFVWSVGRGIIDINPLANVGRPGSETKRERVLSDTELAKVWKATERLGPPYGPAIKLLILTGARRDEIGRLRWSEIVDGAINLEGARTKNDEAHVIPLSTPARTVLDQLSHIGEFVFTSSGHLPISDWTRTKRDLDDLAGVSDWRIHDLRRTAA